MSFLLVVRYPEEGPGLLAWARRAAEGLDLPLEVVACDPEAGTELQWMENGDPRPTYLADVPEVRWARVKLSHTLSTVGRHVIANKVTHVLTGKHNSGKSAHDSPERRLARALFEKLSCAVIVLRLPEKDAIAPGNVLVPAAGGPHSRIALRIASSMAGEAATALYVTPEVDEVSREVAERHLSKVVKRARVDPEEITCRVVLGDNLPDEIRREAGQGDYGLILIGASDSRTLRSKLFGTLPERLLRGGRGLGIGVVRGPHPKGRLFQDTLEKVLRLSVPQLEREERITLVDEVEGKSRWTFDFAALMALATTIASFGLLADSVAVVIGAMLVAPLMTPLIGAGLSLVQGNWPLWLRSARAVVLGFFAALVIGLGAGLIARLVGWGLTGELAARGEPTPLDLGIAFASGIAASYCLARPHLSGALAGVAIAAALVPPIATVGICLSLGEVTTATGAALLFGSNVVAIVLGAAMNFFAAGIRGAGKGLWPRRLVIVFALACAGLAVPLTSQLLGKVSEPLSLRSALEEVAADSGFRVVRLQRLREDRTPLYEMTLEGLSVPPNDLVRRLSDVAQERTGRRLRVRPVLVAKEL